MRIAVLGIGYVGVVSAACLASDGHVVTAVDINPAKVDAVNEGRAPISENGLDALVRANFSAGRLNATTDIERAVGLAELSLICVGTPSMADGALDLTDVVRVCEGLGRVLRQQDCFHTVVLRSTVLPGSTAEVVIPVLERVSHKRAGQDFAVAFYPEFMREGSAITDYREPAAIVFGVEDDRSEITLRKLVEPLRGKIYVTNYAVAEAIKYASNAWHATKITFANEIGNFCSAVGADSYRVMEILCADHRLNISPAYLRPGFAYGGSCLPKDLRALQHRAQAHGLTLPMIASLAVSNSAQIRRAFEIVKTIGYRRVGLLGLSFKGGTDDLRESPAVQLAELLYQDGFELQIFEPNLDLATLTGSNLSYIQARLPHLDDCLTDDLAQTVTFGKTLVVATYDFCTRDLPALAQDQIMVDLVGRRATIPVGAEYQTLYC
jgi:GDP-mannose 6-dehydrogenase